MTDHCRVTPRPFTARVRHGGPLLLLLALVPASLSLPLAASRARAHGDVRGMLSPPAYGGALSVGTLSWLDTKDDMLAGREKIENTRLSRTRDLYTSLGIYYGVLPNTLAGLYIPYSQFQRLEGDVVKSDRTGVGSTSLILQRRLWRRDGDRTRLEAAVSLRGYFRSPGDEAFPELRPTNYRLAAGVQHFGWRDLATLNVGYTGAAHEPSLRTAWTINSAVAWRPVPSITRRGRDLFVGVEGNYRTAVDGSNRRLLLGPLVEVHPIGLLSIAASYGIPVYERVMPQGLGGGSSLWLSSYVRY